MKTTEELARDFVEDTAGLKKHERYNELVKLINKIKRETRDKRRIK